MEEINIYANLQALLPILMAYLQCLQSLLLLLHESNKSFNTVAVQVVKSRKRQSPIEWSFPRHGQFWELDVPNNSDEFFRENFRMDRRTFDILVKRMEGMAKEDTRFRIAIPLEKRIAIALYTMGSSAEYRTVSRLFGVSSPMVCKIFLDFCKKVRRVLAPEYLPSQFLTKAKVQENVRGFQTLGFPQCFGAIDGSHIKVRPPASEATDYYNYKGWYSVILFALVDYRYRFVYVNIGCPGRVHDSKLYECSTLKRMVDETPLFTANSKNINGVDVPVVLIGDSAFKISKSLMKPYPFSVSAPESEKTFNYGLSKARRVVENAFGQLKARFRRIGKGLDNRHENASKIVMAACILHNFLNEKNCQISESWRDQLNELPQPQHMNVVNDYNVEARRIRNAIGEYLSYQ